MTLMSSSANKCQGIDSFVPATVSITIAREAADRKRSGYAKRDIGGVGIAVMDREAAIAELADAIATGATSSSPSATPIWSTSPRMTSPCSAASRPFS